MKTFLIHLFLILWLVPASAYAQNNFIEVEGKASRKLKPETLTYSLEIPLYTYDYDNYDYVTPNEYEEETTEEPTPEVEEDNKSKKKKKKNEEVEPLDYEPVKEPVYHNDYNNDYTEEIEEDPKEKRAKIIDQLSRALGIDPSIIKDNKSLLGEGLYNSGDKLSLLFIIPGSRQGEIEKILDTLTQPQLDNWRLFKAEVSPATRTKVEKELLTEAIQDARTKAQYIAKSENRPLGNLMSVTESPLGTDMLSQIYGNEFKNLFQGMFGGLLTDGDVEINISTRVKFAF
ncbi:MAG: SIMPL domain-containing protein [Microscillaceae bacterium]|nr:SIMPL domain-containing protein [Microscillaceae bacterium]